MAETATTYSAELNYQNEITADEIIVVFNGTTYTVPKRTQTLPNSYTYIYYGTLGLVNNGDAVGEYPFCIYEAHDINAVYVSEDVYDNHNPFTIKIMEESATTTECFEKAVKSVGGEDPVIIPLDKNISAATTSSPVKSSASEVYNKIANALENGVPVYLQESIGTNFLVTAYYAGSGMSDATITVNVETYNSTLNVTYSRPVTFIFDQDGYCYYPPSGSIT